MEKVYIVYYMRGGYYYCDVVIDKVFSDFKKAIEYVKIKNASKSIYSRYIKTKNVTKYEETK